MNICVYVTFDRDRSALYCFPRTNIIDLAYILSVKRQKKQIQLSCTRFRNGFDVSFSIAFYSPLMPQLLFFVLCWNRLSNQSLHARFSVEFDYTLSSLFVKLQSISFISIIGRIATTFLRLNTWLPWIHCLRFVINHGFYVVRSLDIIFFQLSDMRMNRNLLCTLAPIPFKRWFFLFESNPPRISISCVKW